MEPFTEGKGSVQLSSFALTSFDQLLLSTPTLLTCYLNYEINVQSLPFYLLFPVLTIRTVEPESLSPNLLIFEVMKELSEVEQLSCDHQRPRMEYNTAIFSYPYESKENNLT
jgi:hypothetical protein